MKTQNKQQTLSKSEQKQLRRLLRKLEKSDLKTVFKFADDLVGLAMRVMNEVFEK